MKNLRSLLFLMLILTLTLVIASCDRIEEPIDDRLDKLEDRIENQYREDHPNRPASTDGTRADNPTPTEDAYLSRESVELIALEHAGIAAADAEYLRTEFEFDDGFPVYDVSFHANRVEYEYSIHAESGAILEYDRDR